MERIYKIHSIERKASKRIHVVQREDGQRFKRLPVWPEVWTKICKAFQNGEEQEWAKEKPKLDNARKLRGIYFIDPDDKESISKFFKTQERKLERPMAPAMPWKRDQQHSSIVKANAEPKIGNEREFKTVYGCIVESHETTRQRAESLQSKTPEDHIASEGFTSMTHQNLVHKFIPMPQAMKIPDAKAAVDNEWKKLETIPARQLEKVKSKKEVHLEAQRDKKKVHFASLMDICHLKMQS